MKKLLLAILHPLAIVFGRRFFSAAIGPKINARRNNYIGIGIPKEKFITPEYTSYSDSRTAKHNIRCAWFLHYNSILAHYSAFGVGSHQHLTALTKDNAVWWPNGHPFGERKRSMGAVVPFYRKLHVLYLEDDWVIRQILMEHLAVDDSCHIASFANADKALSYLRLECGADRIFSNVHLGGRGGIDLSSCPDWPSQIDLAIAPGYDAEKDRFRAIEAGFGFFRVKPYHYLELWQRIRQTVNRSSFK